MTPVPEPDDNALDKLFPGDMPTFSPGDIVKHKHYGYRGVVVDFDVCCQAPDRWYENNRTQPDRDRPWYHVLVDGSETATYAAEENLLPADDHQPVHHPLVPAFFEAFSEGRYERNSEAWPGWQ